MLQTRVSASFWIRRIPGHRDRCSGPTRHASTSPRPSSTPTTCNPAYLRPRNRCPNLRQPAASLPLLPLVPSRPPLPPAPSRRLLLARSRRSNRDTWAPQKVPRRPHYQRPFFFSVDPELPAHAPASGVISSKHQIGSCHVCRFSVRCFLDGSFPPR